MSKSHRRIAILTGGGDAPGLNAVIRAVAKSAIYQHGWEVLGVEDGFLGLVQNRIHPLTARDVSGILTSGGTILGTSNKCDPKRYVVGQNPDGTPIHRDVTDRVLQHLEHHGIDDLVLIGGDGTMSGAENFVEHGVNCIGVPKTIDNDIVGTELTFGFLTAVQTATDALDRLHTTAMSHHRVMVAEVMGRNAGWIALFAGVASGSDVILIPEIDFDLHVIAEYCERRSERGKRFSIICIAEGAKPKGGARTVARHDPTSPDPVKLGGVGEVLADDLAELAGLETRAVVLGHVLRGGSPIAADRILATQFGNYATHLLAQGKSNRLVVYNQGDLGDVDIRRAANAQRTIEPDEPLLTAARAIGSCMGDEA